MGEYTPKYPIRYPEGVAAARAQLLARDGSDHYATIGYFFQWFAAVEIHLDRLTCWASDQGNYAAYAHLTKGVLPRTKLERLRFILKDNDVTVGPNLADRLAHFEGPILKARNHLAHCFVHLDKKTDVLRLMSVSDFIQQARGARSPACYTIQTLHLFEHGCFLNWFATDLKSVEPPLMKTRSLTLEIDAPKSRLPKADRKDHPPQVARASVDKPSPKEKE